ncbi:MAG: hypothetical protein RIT27_1532, partial [Pseudomonadota bacterium]
SNPQILKSSNPQILKSSNPQILKSSNPQILKSSKNSVKTFARLSSALLLLSQSVYAAEIIGNITGSYITTTSLSNSANKAVSFQMGASDHTLDNVKIVLTAGTGTEADAQTFVELRSHDGTNTPTTNVIATLAPNPLTHTAYGATPTEATFTPASTITLQANTKYWVVARGIATNFLSWQVPSAPPTDGAGTYLAYALSADGGATWNSSTYYNAIQINGTAVSSGAVSAPIDLAVEKQPTTFATEIELK